jgi:hypothetical protein
MRMMADLVRRGRYADEVMGMLARERTSDIFSSRGRPAAEARA